MTIDFKRVRRNRGFRALLSAVWLPYLIVQCTTCPAMATSLARCSGCTDVEPAAEHGRGHRAERNGEHAAAHHDGHDDGGNAAHRGRGERREHHIAQAAPGAPTEDAHDHAPGDDCCSSWNSRATMLAARIVIPSPAAIVLPWSIPKPAQAATVLRSRLARVDPSQNSPPIYLARLTLLL